MGTAGVYSLLLLSPKCWSQSTRLGEPTEGPRAAAIRAHSQGLGKLLGGPGKGDVEGCWGTPRAGAQARRRAQGIPGLIGTAISALEKARHLWAGAASAGRGGICGQGWHLRAGPASVGRGGVLP